MRREFDKNGKTSRLKRGTVEGVIAAGGKKATVVRNGAAAARVGGKAGNPQDKAPVNIQVAQADKILKALNRRLREAAEKGANIVELGEPEQVAERIVKQMPLTKSALAGAVGPCYSTESLRAVLNMTRQGLSKAALQRRVLRLPVQEKDTYIYPAFQVKDGAIIPGLREVLDVLAEGSPRPWTWALWLNNLTGPENRPTRNIDRLADGDLEGVLRDAHRTAVAWAA